jgi:hypothetical protein
MPLREPPPGLGGVEVVRRTYDFSEREAARGRRFMLARLCGGRLGRGHGTAVIGGFQIGVPGVEGQCLVKERPSLGSLAAVEVPVGNPAQHRVPVARVDLLWLAPADASLLEPQPQGGPKSSPDPWGQRHLPGDLRRAPEVMHREGIDQWDQLRCA